MAQQKYRPPAKPLRPSAVLRGVRSPYQTPEISGACSELAEQIESLKSATVSPPISRRKLKRTAARGTSVSKRTQSDEQLGPPSNDERFDSRSGPPLIFLADMSWAATPCPQQPTRSAPFTPGRTEWVHSGFEHFKPPSGAGKRSAKQFSRGHCSISIREFLACTHPTGHLRHAPFHSQSQCSCRWSPDTRFKMSHWHTLIRPARRP